MTNYETIELGKGFDNGTDYEKAYYVREVGASSPWAAFASTSRDKCADWILNQKIVVEGAPWRYHSDKAGPEKPPIERRLDGRGVTAINFIDPEDNSVIPGVDLGQAVKLLDALDELEEIRLHVFKLAMQFGGREMDTVRAALYPEKRR